jgi:hypothetical protein
VRYTRPLAMVHRSCIFQLHTVPPPSQLMCTNETQRPPHIEVEGNRLRFEGRNDTAASATKDVRPPEHLNQEPQGRGSFRRLTPGAKGWRPVAVAARRRAVSLGGESVRRRMPGPGPWALLPPARTYDRTARA